MLSRRRRTCRPRQRVLGGERKGCRIEGFDLGNSPSEYTPETVGGKTLVFTTTNGTKAMLCCRQAEHVLLGSFVNFLAVGRELSTLRRPIHLLCAGTRGQITREDAALAGSLVFLLTLRGAAAIRAERSGGAGARAGSADDGHGVGK